MQLVIVFHNVEITDFFFFFFLLDKQFSSSPEWKMIRQRQVALKAEVSLPAFVPISIHSNLLACV